MAAAVPPRPPGVVFRRPPSQDQTAHLVISVAGGAPRALTDDELARLRELLGPKCSLCFDRFNLFASFEDAAEASRAMQDIAANALKSAGRECSRDPDDGGDRRAGAVDAAAAAAPDGEQQGARCGDGPALPLPPLNVRHCIRRDVQVSVGWVGSTLTLPCMYTTDRQQTQTHPCRTRPPAADTNQTHTSRPTRRRPARRRAAPRSPSPGCCCWRPS